MKDAPYVFMLPLQRFAVIQIDLMHILERMIKFCYQI